MASLHITTEHFGGYSRAELAVHDATAGVVDSFTFFGTSHLPYVGGIDRDTAVPLTEDAADHLAAILRRAGVDVTRHRESPIPA
jgi:hypothetical protein